MPLHSLILIDLFKLLFAKSLMRCSVAHNIHTWTICDPDDPLQNGLISRQNLFLITFVQVSHWGNHIVNRGVLSLFLKYARKWHMSIHMLLFFYWIFISVETFFFIKRLWNWSLSHFRNLEIYSNLSAKKSITGSWRTCPWIVASCAIRKFTWHLGISWGQLSHK